MSAGIAITGLLKKSQLGVNFIRRNPLYYDRTRRLLDRLESLDFNGRRDWTNDQLARVLSHAKRTDYGRAVHGGDTLTSWPLLEKESLRHALNAFTARRDWFSAPATTGGSSGVPLKLVRSLEAIVFEQATIDRVIESVGADPRTARTAVLRGDNPRDIVMTDQPAAEIIVSGRIMTFSANAVTHVSVEHIANSIEEFAPQLLCAYPSALETLMRYLHESGRKLSIPTVVTSSEVMKPGAWGMAQDVLGCKLADYYGQSERIAFAIARAPRTYHFQPGYSHVEFIPYDGKVLARGSGMRLYEIVGTSLWNDVLPIVRYRTGDLIRLPAHWGEQELEELSLGFRSFDGVLGRQQEIIVVPDGSLRLTGIGLVPREVKNVLRIQIVQEDFDRARIFVLPTPEYSESDAEDLLANARSRIPQEVSLSVEVAKRLERTPRGKTPLIVHRPPVHDALRRQGIEPLFTR
jgi:phenylacetate-CoA ligase